MHVTNFITSALNDGMFCLSVFIDLRKALHVCSHKILFKKIKNLGINCIAIKWFESYLSDRLQKIDIHRTQSEEKCLFQHICNSGQYTRYNNIPLLF